jgi:hypothetical protein
VRLTRPALLNCCLCASGFVNSGGSYLGLCAGAYYACSSVQFEQGSRLQVLGDRELAFFPGIACGAAYPGGPQQQQALPQRQVAAAGMQMCCIPGSSSSSGVLLRVTSIAGEVSRVVADIICQC